MNDKKVSIVLMGISGYGHTYLKKIFSDENENAYLEGVIEINPKRSDYYDDIQERGIPIYDSVEAFYEQKKADLAIIATPIHLHKEQSCYAMNQGSNILCEKPMTGDPDDIKEMIETRDKTGTFFAVGFNMSFNPSIQGLKQDILSGVFGKAKRFKSIHLTPRVEDYYQRSSWAGKEYSPDGRMIFDSVGNNATAHSFHNLLYLAGDAIETSAQIDQVTAEMYKANDIETFDTCAVEVKTETTIDIYYFTSHATPKNHSQQFILEFEKATVTYNPDDGKKEIVAIWKDGSQKVYSDPMLHQLIKFDICVDAIVQGHQDILCGIEGASAHVRAINKMHQSVPNVPRFPANITRRDDEKKLNWIEGLEDNLITSYDKWCLPNELGITWTKKGKTIK